MKYKAYIGTYSMRGSKGIYLTEVDGHTGEMHILDAYESCNPSYLALSRDKKYLYCVLETEEIDGLYGGAAASFRVNEDATLTFISKAYTGGTYPCHLTADKDNRFLYVANYGDGKLTIFPIDGGVIVNKPEIIQHKGSGPNKDRQEGPHIHCAVFDRREERLCVADLGIDKAVLYKAGKGTIVEGSIFEVKPGAGPRHVVFSGNGRYAWLVCELTNEIYAYDAQNSKCIGVYKTLPRDFSGDSTCAAIKISQDGRFVCASNRGHDSISVFGVKEETGELTLTGVYSTRGNTPRDFSFSPDGRFLLAANQNSDTIEVFSFLNGHLEHTGYSVNIPAPSCIVFL